MVPQRDKGGLKQVRKSSKNRRRRLRQKNEIEERSTCADVARGNPITRNFRPGKGSARTEREQFSLEEWNVPDYCKTHNSGQPAGSPCRKQRNGPPSGIMPCFRSFRALSVRSNRYKPRFPNHKAHSCAKGSSRAVRTCQDSRRQGSQNTTRISRRTRPPQADDSRRMFSPGAASL